MRGGWGVYKRRRRRTFESSLDGKITRTDWLLQQKHMWIIIFSGALGSLQLTLFSWLINVSSLNVYNCIHIEQTNENQSKSLNKLAHCVVCYLVYCFGKSTLCPYIPFQWIISIKIQTIIINMLLAWWVFILNIDELGCKKYALHTLIDFNWIWSRTCTFEQRYELKIIGIVHEFDELIINFHPKIQTNKTRSCD